MPALERVLSIGLLGGGDKTRDYKGFLDGYREASALSPENPNLLYRVARGYALVGNADAAVAILGRLAAMHLVYPIADHPDLVSLRDHPGFRAAVARMARNGEPKGASEVAFTFPEDDLLIEGLAHDAKTGRFFVSSVHRRKIMVIDKEGVRAEPRSSWPTTPPASSRSIRRPAPCPGCRCPLTRRRTASTG